MSRVENIEIGIFNTATIEVGGGVGFRLKQGGILSFTFALGSNQVSFFLSSAKANILGNFWLVLFVRENKRVVSRVASIKKSPPFSRVCGVLKFCTQGWFSGDGR